MCEEVVFRSVGDYEDCLQFCVDLVVVVVFVKVF